MRTYGRTHRQTDRQKDNAKIIVAFRHFANVLKICLQYPYEFPIIIRYTERSEIRCALTKCDGSDVHECLYRSELELNRIKQLHTLPVLHFNRSLTTEYSETTAHFNGNFDTDNQMYVP
jgi:hypothetical protein